MKAILTIVAVVVLSFPIRPDIAKDKAVVSEKNSVVEISLKDLLRNDKEYKVHVDDGDCCRPLGEVYFGDIKMMFVEKQEEEPDAVITLPVIPEEEAGNIKEEPKYTGKMTFLAGEEIPVIPAWHDLRERRAHPGEWILVPNKDLQKDRKGISYSTTPLYKRQLADGSSEFTLVNPDGSETKEIIPPLPK